MTSRNARFPLPAILFCIVLVGLGIGWLMPEQESSLTNRLALKDSDDVPQVDSSDSAPQSADSVPTFGLSPLDIHDQLQRPCLASDGSGNVWLAWESKTTERDRSVFLARSTDGGKTFNEPTPVRSTTIYEWDAIVRGRPARRATRMWPHLAFANQQLILSWVESGADDPGEQTLMCARSTDLGASFGAPTRLSSQSAVRPSFVGFAAAESGTVTAAWLDHRHDAQQPFAASPLADGTDQIVYPGPDDAGICPCCELAAAFTAAGDTVVAFRNSLDGFRDMWVSVRTADQSQFAAPIAVVEPRWEFNGCPHDGPSLTVVGDRLHVVWMDGHTGIQQVYRAEAKIGDWRFETRPINPSDTVQAHPSIAADGDKLWIVWDESSRPTESVSGHSDQAPSSGGSVILMVMSADRGQTWSAPIEVSPPTDAFASRPVLVGNSGNPIVAWTCLSENGKQLLATRLEAASQEQLRMRVAYDED